MAAELHAKLTLLLKFIIISGIFFAHTTLFDGPGMQCLHWRQTDSEYSRSVTFKPPLWRLLHYSMATVVW